MKKVLLIYIMITNMITASDTSHVLLKDTLITKSINPNTFWNYNFLQTFISVLAGALLTLFGVWLSNKHQKNISDKQIKHQLLIAQANIDVESNRKIIDDLVKMVASIADNVFTILSLTNDFVINISIAGNIEKEMYEIKEDLAGNGMLFDQFTKNYNDVLRKVDSIFDKIYETHKLFTYNNESIFLYIKKDDIYYEKLYNLSKTLQNSYKAFVDNYRIQTNIIANIEEIRKKAGDKLTEDNTMLLDAIKEIIDAKRKENDEMIIFMESKTKSSMGGKAVP